MFNDFKSLFINGVEMKSLYTSDGVCLFKGNATPYDAEVQYIQSDGTNSIDSGVVPVIKGANATHFFIRYCPTTKSQWVTFGTAANDQHEVRYVDGGSYSYFDIGNSRINGMQITAGTTYCLEFGVRPFTEIQYINYYDDDYNYISGSIRECGSETITNDTFSICGHPTGAEAPMKLYFARIYSGNTLIRDFIPVRKDGKGYMYDKVEGKLYGNNRPEGNDFTYGPDAYVPLQYVESDRSQYLYASPIGNQIKFANPGIDMKFDWLDDNPVTSQQHGAFGCERLGNSNYRWTINNWSSGGSGGIRGELFTGINGYNLEIEKGSSYHLVISRNSSVYSYDPLFPNYIYLKKNDDDVGFPMSAGRTDTGPVDYYNGNHFCLFGQQHSSGVDPVANRLTAKIRLYYFKAYNYYIDGVHLDDGVPYVVCDMIPAKDPTTGRVGLWDKFWRKMVYSVTSSDLIAGPEA